jgi:hypothetical protein
MIFNKRNDGMKTTRIVTVAVLMVASAWALQMLWARQAVNTPAMRIERSAQI